MDHPPIVSLRNLNFSLKRLQKSKKIAEILKEWIQNGKFLLMKIQAVPKRGSVFGEFLQGKQGWVRRHLNVVNDVLFLHPPKDKFCKDKKHPQGGAQTEDPHQERHPETILL